MRRFLRSFRYFGDMNNPIIYDNVAKSYFQYKLERILGILLRLYRTKNDHAISSSFSIQTPRQLLVIQLRSQLIIL
jgi:hypothetical protein